MQARLKKDSSSTFIDLDTTNGGISIDEINGEITLLITDEQTSLINVNGGFYDLKIGSSDGQVTRIMEGRVKISKRVTR